MIDWIMLKNQNCFTFLNCAFAISFQGFLCFTLTLGFCFEELWLKQIEYISVLSKQYWVHRGLFRILISYVELLDYISVLLFIVSKWFALIYYESCIVS